MSDNNFSELFDQFNIDPKSISPEMINNIMGMFNNQSNFQSTNNTNGSFNNIDMETLIKMKSIIDKMNSNQNDPRSNLLLSLKPYLKESRQNKLDQYIQLLNMSKLLDVFPFMGGDSKKHEWFYLSFA